MELYFHEPGDIPLPPNEVHIRKINAEPYKDGRRVKVSLDISPFQKRPSGEVSIYKENDKTPVAIVSFIETLVAKMDLTLHLRELENTGNYSVEVLLFYEEPIQEPREGDTNTAISLPKRNFVDRKTAKFTIKSSV